MILKTVRFIVLWIFSIGVLGGSGLACFTRPSSPPVPSAEIPPFLVFPATTSISVGQIAPALKLAVPAGGAFSEEVTSGAVTASDANVLNDTALSPVGGVRVSITASALNYDSAEDPNFSGADPIKIDFGDFDLDGDGAVEGCSGCTCPVGCAGSCPTSAAITSFSPICFRIWVNRTGTFERWLAGKVTEPPADSDEDGVFENPGAGRYRSSLALDEGGTQHAILLGAIYDHTDLSDPLKKSTELFLRDDTAASRERAHTLTEQEASFSGAAAASEVRKTLKIHAKETDPAETTDLGLLEYFARFRDDENFWIGTVADESGTAADNQCVDLRTGEAAAAEECSNVGLSLDGSNVGAATDADVAFPGTDQFPSDPCDAPNLGTSTGCL